MAQDSVAASIRSYEKLYPYGIPLNMERPEFKTMQFYGPVTAEILMIVDYDWQSDPWQGEAGGLLEAIIEKGVKSDKNQVRIVRADGSLNADLFEPYSLLISFAEELETSEKVINTYTLNELVDDPAKKREFWEELKKHVS